MGRGGGIFWWWRISSSTMLPQFMQRQAAVVSGSQVPTKSTNSSFTKCPPHRMHTIRWLDMLGRAFEYNFIPARSFIFKMSTDCKWYSFITRAPSTVNMLFIQRKASSWNHSRTIFFTHVFTILGSEYHHRKTTDIRHRENDPSGSLEQ